MKFKSIGILGGTFDPIHYGHLRLAESLLTELNLEEVKFVPCQLPVLDKIPQATPQQRLTMLKLGIQNQKKFVIDERELKRNTPSYTVDTLLSLRQDLGNASLSFIIGSDALQNIIRWHRWQEILHLSHLIVVPRPGYLIPTQGAIAELVTHHKVENVTLLHQKLAGYVFIANIELSSISSSEIRSQIAVGLQPTQALPKNVWEYIKQQQIYFKKSA